MVKKTEKTSAMAFYHADGFVPAWKHAAAFAGDDGRIATLPDIIDARLAERSAKSAPWGQYYTTASAEYMGRSSGGNRIIIVAHGVGPMSTLDGIVKAYSHEFKDKSRNRRGGRITQKEFLKLESGHYGDVAIVDLDSIIARYEYAFMENLRLSQCLTEPLFAARFGSRFAAYLERHAREAREWLRSNREGHGPASAAEIADPYLVELGDAGNCSYRHRTLEEGKAFAHLLSIGQLTITHHEGSERAVRRERHTSLVTDVDCFEWWNGVRLLGVRGKEKVDQVHKGPNPRSLLWRHWERLFKPVEEPTSVGFRALTKVGKEWFTQYPKQGERMDTCDPEFRVTKCEEISGGPATFTTTEGGGFFFKYGIKEVERIAPPGANAYYLPDEVTRGGLGFITPIQFFRVEVDTSRRLPTDDEIGNKFDLMMELIESEETAAE